MTAKKVDPELVAPATRNEAITQTAPVQIRTEDEHPKKTASVYNPPHDPSAPRTSKEDFDKIAQDADAKSQEKK